MMVTVRDTPTATVLPSGSVLIVGGYNTDAGFVDTAETYG